MQLALTPDGKWDVATADLVSAASAAGFGAVGINADAVDTVAVEAYADAGVRCHELLAFVVGDDEAATMATAEQLADRAQTIAADWVLTVFTAKVPPKTIQRCAKMFDDAGAGIAVEYTPLGAIPTISDGMTYVRAAGETARAGLMIDSWHFCFSAKKAMQAASAVLRTEETRRMPYLRLLKLLYIADRESIREGERDRPVSH